MIGALDRSRGAPLLSSPRQILASHDPQPASRRFIDLGITQVGTRLLLGIVLVAASSSVAMAQEQATFELIFENDALIGAVPGIPDSDREYTSGLTFAVERGGAPLWGVLTPSIPACGERYSGFGSCARTRFETGHKMFTPDWRKPWVTQPQRPFAAWLSGSITALILSPTVASALRVEAGFTGPPAMGEHVQNFIHKLLNSSEADGWDRQLEFEPALLIEYREDYLLDVDLPGGKRMDLIPMWRVSLGNLRTGAQVGLRARAGGDMPHPWLPSEPGPDISVYGFVAVRETWTRRDLFLDGVTLEEIDPIEKRPFRAEAELGGTVVRGNLRLTSSLILEERRYETQPTPHRYVRVVLSYTPQTTR
ncbi:MAG: DUF2219 family protein [Gemmatimonas sp.]|nr:DUF2219 family protein [Gemmatimonas sp.]